MEASPKSLPTRNEPKNLPQRDGRNDERAAVAVLHNSRCTIPISSFVQETWIIMEPDLTGSHVDYHVMQQDALYPKP